MFSSVPSALRRSGVPLRVVTAFCDTFLNSSDNSFSLFAANSKLVIKRIFFSSSFKPRYEAFHASHRMHVAAVRNRQAATKWRNLQCLQYGKAQCAKQVDMQRTTERGFNGREKRCMTFEWQKRRKSRTESGFS